MQDGTVMEEGGKCGTHAGDLITWDELNWKRETVSDEQEGTEVTLHGKTTTKMIPHSDGPCHAKSDLNLFTINSKSSFECMEHCKKLGGRSPPLITQEEWSTLDTGLALLSSKFDHYEHFWLSVTQGIKNRPKHWDKDIQGHLGVWRDYYTGM